MSQKNREQSNANEIRERYREMIEARAVFQRQQGDHFEGAAHEAYHDAVFNLYAELRGRLKHRDEANELWEEVELWPTETVFVDVAICPACTAYEDLDEDANYGPGDRCPNCGEADLELRERPEIGDDGQAVQKWETGLKNLGKYRNRMRQYTKEYSDALGTHEETVTERELLDPFQLEVVADLFGEAMELLALYPDAQSQGDFEKYDIE
ncbi:hypothetical protein [Halorubrum sp. BV1]|uniref:hypothetical protein n=1 Tax=Halorubrum sp. BV1 TaxID=1498500 RepID=UPI0006792166|nr:hypothetical protein [Halorubrum sp. BV1]